MLNGENMNEYNKDKWGLTVRGIIKNNDDEILLLKRHHKSRNDPEKWEFPGGKVDKGEYFEAALIREFKEETNLDINVKELYDAVENEFISCKDGNIVKTVQIIMKVNIKSGELKLSHEHEDYRWLKIDEIKGLYNENLLSSTVEKVLKKQEFNI